MTVIFLENETVESSVIVIYSEVNRINLAQTLRILFITYAKVKCGSNESARALLISKYTILIPFPVQPLPY